MMGVVVTSYRIYRVDAGLLVDTLECTGRPRRKHSSPPNVNSSEGETLPWGGEPRTGSAWKREVSVASLQYADSFACTGLSSSLDAELGNSQCDQDQPASSWAGPGEVTEQECRAFFWCSRKFYTGSVKRAFPASWGSYESPTWDSISHKDQLIFRGFTWHLHGVSSQGLVIAVYRATCILFVLFSFLFSFFNENILLVKYFFSFFIFIF